MRHWRSACPFEDALKRLEESRETNTSADTMPPLFDTQEEYDAFLVRHNASRPPEADIHTYAGPAWLGMDAGSTTTKLALITADGGLHLYLPFDRLMQGRSLS